MLQTTRQEQVMQWLLNNEGAAKEIRKNFPRSGGFAISGNSYVRVKGEMKKATDYLKEAGFEHGQQVCMHRVIFNDADDKYPERFVFFPLKVADAPDFD